jgi:hypothetical protein
VQTNFARRSRSRSENPPRVQLAEVEVCAGSPSDDLICQTPALCADGILRCFEGPKFWLVVMGGSLDNENSDVSDDLW